MNECADANLIWDEIRDLEDTIEDLKAIPAGDPWRPAADGKLRQKNAALQLLRQQVDA